MENIIETYNKEAFFNDIYEGIPIGKILIKKNIPVELNPNKIYKQVTVKVKHQGVELRGLKKGIEIASKQYLANDGDFIISKIDARNGSMGIIPPELDNAIVTSDFPLYNVKNTVDLSFFNLFTKTHYFDNACKWASEGSTNRRRIKFDRFNNILIPLPPLLEQKRIVAKIESIKGKIETIQKIRAEQEREMENFRYCIFEDLINKYGTKLLKSGIKNRMEFIQIDDTKRYKLCRVQTKSQGVVLREIKSGFDIKTKKQQVCKEGDFIVAEMDARYGGYGLIPDKLIGSIVSSHYFLFEFDEKILNRKYLNFYSKTHWFFSQVEAQGSTNYAAIRPKQVLNYEIPLPAVDKQNEIVSLLNKMEQIRLSYQKQEEELTELLSSLLDKAFKGEL